MCQLKKAETEKKKAWASSKKAVKKRTQSRMRNKAKVDAEVAKFKADYEQRHAELLAKLVELTTNKQGHTATTFPGVID